MKMNLRDLCLRLLISLSAGFLLFAFEIQPVAAHGSLPTKEFAIPILEETVSGPYRVSAIQYSASDFWVVELHVEGAEGTVSPSTQAVATIVSVQTGVEESKGLLRYQDTFIARLPLIEDSWNVVVTLSSESGEGQVAFTTLPHSSRESDPVVQGLVIVTPFVLTTIGLFVYRRFGLSLIQ